MRESISGLRIFGNGAMVKNIKFHYNQSTAMKQFILNTNPDKDGFIRLEGDDYHYLVRVRRLAVGEFFPALLPGGEETLVQVVSISENFLTVKYCQDYQKDNPAGSCELPPIVLFQALPKGDKMDLIVRQAAEGGISEIVPFVSEFSIAKTGAVGQKFSRWERIIREARQQSGSRIATALHKPLTRDELFDYWKKIGGDGALGLLFHHCEVRQKGLDNNSLHGYLKIYPNRIAFAIGPEGGFSDKEVSVFAENGFKLLTIGDSVLRTETAALYCAAAIKIILLERNAWELSKAK